MKILVTGGAGCLGSNIIEHLIPKGHKICVIDNLATGNKDLVSGIRNINFFEFSIFEKDKLFNVFEEFLPDLVINSAASYKNPDNWIEDSNTNIIGSINLVDACKNFNVQRVINFQTALAYGIPKKIPIPVDHQLSPITSYGISKSAGENYFFSSGLEVLSLRISNVTGPRLSIGPIPTFYKRLKEGKSCFCTNTFRDFLDIDDFLNFIDLSLERNINGKFNVSSGRSNSIKDVFDHVANYLNINTENIDVPIIEPSADDISKVILDPSATIKQFDWEVKVSFGEMIKKQLQWYDKYGVDRIFSHLKNNG